MKAPYTLVGHGGSTETIACLEHWLAEAKRGALVGVAGVLIFKRRHFSVHTCGEAHRSPVFTRGCVEALSDELGNRVRNQGGHP